MNPDVLEFITHYFSLVFKFFTDITIPGTSLTPFGVAAGLLIFACVYKVFSSLLDMGNGGVRVLWRNSGRNRRSDNE